MATKNTATTTPADPTLGIPTVPAKAPKTVVVSGAPAPIAKGRRKARPSGADLKAATEFARKQTGYNELSPIWNRKQIDVLVEIESLLALVDSALDIGAQADPDAVRTALNLNRELQKRIATNQLIAAQTR